MEEKKANTKKKSQTKKYYPPKKKEETKSTKKIEEEKIVKETKKEPIKVKERKKENPALCKLLILIFIGAVLLGLMIFVVYKSIMNKSDDSNEISEIIINKETTSLNVNEGGKIKYVLQMPNDNIDNIIWTVDNNDVVRVVDKYIEGLKAGKTSVMVSDGNSFEYVFEINVVSFNDVNKIADVDPTGVGLSRANLTVNIGNTVKVTAVVFPDNANQVVTWNSDNESIATVDNYGNIKGIAKGNTKIYATTSNGISISCDVVVQ